MTRLLLQGQVSALPWVQARTSHVKVPILFFWATISRASRKRCVRPIRIRPFGGPSVETPLRTERIQGLEEKGFSALIGGKGGTRTLDPGIMSAWPKDRALAA